MSIFNFFKKPANVKKVMPVSGGMMNHAQQVKQMIDSLAKGGPVKKTGVYKVHKGEKILNKALNNKK